MHPITLSRSAEPSNKLQPGARPPLGSIDIPTLTPPHAARRVARRDASGAIIRGSASGRKYRSVDAGWSRSGLSVHHFARQFKQTAGVTPHLYLAQNANRERAREMLSLDRSLVSGNCVRRRLFQPRSSSTPFPLYARLNASRVSVVATLETEQPFSAHTLLTESSNKNRKGRLQLYLERGNLRNARPARRLWDWR